MSKGRQTIGEIRKDAEGQFAPKQAGGQSDGVASAKPTVITGSEDATLHNRPPVAKREKQKKSSKP